MELAPLCNVKTGDQLSEDQFQRDITTAKNRME